MIEPLNTPKPRDISIYESEDKIYIIDKNFNEYTLYLEHEILIPPGEPITCNLIFSTDAQVTITKEQQILTLKEIMFGYGNLARFESEDTYMPPMDAQELQRILQHRGFKVL
jgi:hypothetical protein